MNHFALADWSDFVRLAAPEDLSQNMQNHLESGCDPCTSAELFIRELYQFAALESSFEPPQSLIRMAVAEFAVANLTADLGSGLVRAELSFDSFQCATLGVRSAGTASRHLLYKCGEVCVDMLLEPRLGSKQVMLSGQLVDGKGSIDSLADMPVLLIKEGAKLSETNTNKFGEFSLGYETAARLELLFKLTTRAFVVPIPEPYVA